MVEAPRAQPQVVVQDARQWLGQHASQVEAQEPAVTVRVAEVVGRHDERLERGFTVERPERRTGEDDGEVTRLDGEEGAAADQGADIGEAEQRGGWRKR